MRMQIGTESPLYKATSPNYLPSRGRVASNECFYSYWPPVTPIPMGVRDGYPPIPWLTTRYPNSGNLSRKLQSPEATYKPSATVAKFPRGMY